jgi:adenosylcobyric acid synthase
VRGGLMNAAEYHEHEPMLLLTVLDSLASLRERFDVVLLEGAGSPTGVSLLPHDIREPPHRPRSRSARLVVGDIDLGGVFAAFYGTVALLPERARRVSSGGGLITIGVRRRPFGGAQVAAS